MITTMIPAKAFMYGRNMNLLKTSSSMEETVVVIWNTIASTHLWRSSSSCCWIWWLWWLWWWRMTLTGFQWSGQDGAQTHWTNPGGDSKHWRPVDNNDGHDDGNNDDDDCDGKKIYLVCTAQLSSLLWFEVPHNTAAMRWYHDYYGFDATHLKITTCTRPLQVPYSLDSRWKYVEWKFW